MDGKRAKKNTSNKILNGDSMIKYISFDMDGTLIDEKYDHLFWNVEIPKAYAEKNNLSLEEAKNKVYSEYYSSLYIEKITNWTDYHYWLKRLEISEEKVTKILLHEALQFKDAKEILEYLSKKYKLIIVTHGDPNLSKFKLRDLKKYFSKIIHVMDDYNLPKSKHVFELIIKDLKIAPEEIVHIGDTFNDDYLSPQAAGIKSYLLRRKVKKEELQENEINSLLDLKKVL